MWEITWALVFTPPHITLKLAYTVFSRVRARLRVSAHPPFLMLLWFMCIYVICTNDFSLYIGTNFPVCWPINFKHPWVVTRENTVHVDLPTCNTEPGPALYIHIASIMHPQSGQDR